jgi:hypothetical protein
MEFKNTEVWGFEHALRGMRNPKNSWDRSDSHWEHNYLEGNHYVIGENDMKLAQNLIRGGTEHAKFLRMIHVSVDVDMPRYWWSEADTYHFNTKNSCSTMHKLLNNNTPITRDLFITCEEDEEFWESTINRLESLRQEYKTIQGTTKNARAMNRLLVRAKRMLPEGFLQLRTWDTNYAELRNMYFQRRYHGLKEEWVEAFCKWLESLPYAKEFIMFDVKKPSLTKEEKDVLIKLIENEQIKHMIVNEKYDTEEYILLEQLKVKMKEM